MTSTPLQTASGPAPAGQRSIPTGLALLAIHLGACAAVVPLFFSWSGVLVAFALYYVTGGIGVCLGYHRLLTHRSMRVPRALEYVFATAGALAMQGGPISWVATHRAHHAFSDTEKDPHDSRRGFMWSHVEWLYRRNPARLTKEGERRFAPDLAADPYYRFLEPARRPYKSCSGSRSSFSADGRGSSGESSSVWS